MAKRTVNIKEAQDINTGALLPATGEAHSNAFIDNCMRCAPMWGVVAVPEEKSVHPWAPSAKDPGAKVSRS